MNTETTTLADLGWRNTFQAQLSLEEFENLKPMRVTALHRDRLDALGVSGEASLPLPVGMTAADIAVGDWLLSAGDTIIRLLERQSVIHRMAAGEDANAQLIAANVDTLLIVSSCNADFNIARLERFLALALQAEIVPVVVLTKADMADDPDAYVDRCRDAIPIAEVVTLNATDAQAVAATLAPWCGKGQSVALVGTSGVGKSTLVNALSGADQDTSGIREDDARGRHTTTSRSLHRITGGAWLIDTPGMRSLRLMDQREGIDAVFDDLAELARQCRFSDCAHASEPGCAIQAEIAQGTLDAARLARWQKLLREDARHNETLADRHARDRQWQKQIAGGKARTIAKRRGPGG